MLRAWRTIAPALVLVTAISVANAQTYTFADIPWGATSQQVLATLRAKGYKDLVQEADGDISFTGKYAGFEAVGRAGMADGKLVKMIYNLITPDEKAIRCYEDLRETLIRKYGEPSMTIRNFSDPYYDGDGFEDTAIRIGKAQIASIWQASGCEACGMMVSITDVLTVRLDYESPEWNAEADRRSAAAADDF